MQRCVSRDEISHFIGLILHNVVYGILNQPRLDVSAAICMETFCDLWNQLGERVIVVCGTPATDEQPEQPQPPSCLPGTTRERVFAQDL